MFYLLKERYRLRGWERLPYAIQDTETGDTNFIDEITFQAASLCNGILDLGSPVVFQKHKEALEKLLKDGVIRECEQGETLQEDQKYRLLPCRFIRQAHWSITGKCNLKCRHCYLSAPQGKYGELSREQCLKIVDDLADAGITRVSLTGGEPLIRSDFLGIVDALLEKKIIITQIYTNGVAVNELLLTEFEKRGAKPEFSLSFDGVGQHDWLRGVEGAEESAIRAIKLLRQRDFAVTIETALHKKNLDTLEATLDLLAELGVVGWKTAPVSQSGNWKNEKGKYNVSLEELWQAYLELIPKYKSKGAPLSMILGGFFECSKGSNTYTIPGRRFDGSEKTLQQTVCPSARNGMYIAPDGKPMPCMPMAGVPFVADMPNITEVSICEALKDSTYLKLIDTRICELLDANSECNKCEHKLYCGGGCRAGALISGGSYLGCDRDMCHFFKNGYEAKIKALYE